MNELRIRTATPDDAGAIADHSRAMAQETEDLRLDPARVLAGTRRLIAQPERGFYLLVEREKTIIAQLMITHEWSDWRDGDFWWIQSVYVRPEHRRQGVFRALFAQLLTRARREPRVCGLRLYAHRSNGSAHEVYRSLGLAETHYLMFETDWSEAERTAGNPGGV
jgi:GNAT superfamily N-acetyltransferase